MDANGLSQTFVNELGNTILVNVQPAPPIQGTEQLTLTMQGPTSLSENTITRQEAEILLQVLMRYLQHAQDA